MKVQLVEEQKYNETCYWIKIDGIAVCYKKTYEEAKEEFDKAASFEPKETTLEEKEI
jgi:hypothetical protein